MADDSDGFGTHSVKSLKLLLTEAGDVIKTLGVHTREGTLGRLA